MRPEFLKKKINKTGISCIYILYMYSTVYFMLNKAAFIYVNIITI